MAQPQDKDLSTSVSASTPAETANPSRPYAQAAQDPRALRILAKTIYREMRQGGLTPEDVMSVAGELLSLVTGDMQERRVESPLSTPRSSREVRKA